MSVSLLFHTIRHLRAQQIIGQLKKRFVPFWDNPKCFTKRHVPVFPGCRWHESKSFPAPGMQHNPAEDILQGRLTFLNSSRQVSWPPDWNITGTTKLWLYNLHYLEYLWALDYPSARDLLGHWIENYPLKKRRDGWEPYPTSLRLMNICAFFWGQHHRQTVADPDFTAKLWASVFGQCQWLSRHIEYCLLGNHLFENGAALIFTGNCFQGPQAARWLRLGRKILKHEINEQILPDGVHFERSPMYQLRVMYVLSLLLQAGEEHLKEDMVHALKNMVAALKCLCHPDGQIALLNDSAFGIYNTPQAIIDYAQQALRQAHIDTAYISQSPVGIFQLPDAGYYGMADQHGNYIVCDAGPLGPDYMPGHGHADMFSFEMSLKGHRVIVDSGVHDYSNSELRRYCRSTKAHNTLEIDQQNQCELWHVFRLARRAHPFQVHFTPNTDGFTLDARHDGYRRLKNTAIHNRQFKYLSKNELCVSDHVSSNGDHSLVSRLHFHPDCQLDHCHANQAQITYPAGKLLVVFQGNGRLECESSYYCPQFGLKQSNLCLAFHAQGRNIDMGFTISCR